jgi:GNAT superfamily N-acetyltransferase
MEVLESTFEEVYPICNEQLWPGRISKIENMSSLFWLQPKEITKNHSIFEKYSPTFFVIKEDNKIVGVNSGFRTDDKVYRSRGLWVKEDYRSKGYGKVLLMQAIIQGKSEDCHWIWSMPRKLALKTYESVGFKKRGKWLDHGVEFGPNCLATRQLIYK